MAKASPPFKPALLVIDVQEDFCPPNGSLAVPDGRAIIPAINALLALPFAARVATRDWHPADHVSFAATHHNGPSPPPPELAPFTGAVRLTNPADAADVRPTTLWPVHCVQGTPGAALAPELNAERLDLVVDKGLDAGGEMYSPFADIFGNAARRGVTASEELGPWLRARGVTDVFVAGLAGDYCVRWAACDAARQGFRTWLVRDAQKCIDAGKGWEETVRQLEELGGRIVSSDGEEVGRVRALGAGK